MTIIFHDTFAGVAGTALTAHTPDTVGTSWVETKSGTSIQEIDSNPIRADASATEGNQHHTYRGRPNPTSAEYDVEITLSTVFNSNTRTYYTLGRYTDVSNFYGYELHFGVQKLFKKVGGTPTELASLTQAFSNNDVFKLEVRNATKKCFQNGIERLSSTDNVITGAGEYGYGLGDLITAGDDINTGWDTTEFLCDEVAGGVVNDRTIRSTVEVADSEVRVQRLRSQLIESIVADLTDTLRGARERDRLIESIVEDVTDRLARGAVHGRIVSSAIETDDLIRFVSRERGRVVTSAVSVADGLAVARELSRLLVDETTVADTLAVFRERFRRLEDAVDTFDALLREVDKGVIARTIRSEVEVTDIVIDKRRVKLDCRCIVDGKKVLVGEAMVMAPSRKFD